MKEIPEDISAIADRIAGDSIERAEIAEALMAERDRCARIADGWAEPLDQEFVRNRPGEADMLQQGIDVAKSIAADIRSGK